MLRLATALLTLSTFAMPAAAEQVLTYHNSPARTGAYKVPGLTVAAAGVAIGLAATWMIRPVVAHLLSDAGVDTTGPAQSIVMNSAEGALVSVVAIFAVTLAASWLPAHRAAQIEPMEALRTE